MWVFLIIGFVIAVFLWQIPAVGPLISILFVTGLVWLFWYVMKPRKDGRKTITPQEAEALRLRTEQAKVESRTKHVEIRINPFAPLTPEQLRQIEQQDRELEARLLAEKAGKKAGEVEGIHHTEWAPIIHQLKRDGKLEEALELALDCIDATERQGRIDPVRGFAPGYTTQAAIIYRKLKNFDGEVAVLERYLRVSGAHSTIEERLVKARTLRDKAEGGN